ncbi:MAG TPA: hypothetical protein VFV27_02290 [Nevskiaceae bacterium]|nr:hypothetical protein [Nevskiaceae bacterium]
MTRILSSLALAGLMAAAAPVLGQGYYYYYNGIPIVISGGSISGGAAPARALGSALATALGGGTQLYAALVRAGGAVDSATGYVTGVIQLKNADGQNVDFTLTVTPDGTIVV